MDHLERIALLETVHGKKFLFAPVGVDEGWTVDAKLELIKKGRVISQKFHLPEKVGVLSGGALGISAGMNWWIRSLADAELVAGLGNAQHYEILIEDAVEDLRSDHCTGWDFGQSCFPDAHLFWRGARAWRASGKYR